MKESATAVLVTKETKCELYRQWAPAKWFKPKPGLKFRDESGDPCIVLGWDSTDLVYAVRVASPEITTTKKKVLWLGWEFRTIDLMTPLDSTAEPGWTHEQEEQISGE